MLLILQFLAFFVITAKKREKMLASYIKQPSIVWPKTLRLIPLQQQQATATAARRITV